MLVAVELAGAREIVLKSKQGGRFGTVIEGRGDGGAVYDLVDGGAGAEGRPGADLLAVPHHLNRIPCSSLGPKNKVRELR